MIGFARRSGPKNDSRCGASVWFTLGHVAPSLDLARINMPQSLLQGRLPMGDLRGQAAGLR